MSISRSTIESAWRRSGARCECTRFHHVHGARRCGASLEWVNRGRHGEGAWEIHREGAVGEGAGDAIAVFCWDCHAKDIYIFPRLNY